VTVLESGLTGLFRKKQERAEKGKNRIGQPKLAMGGSGVFQSRGPAPEGEPREKVEVRHLMNFVEGPPKNFDTG